MPQKIKYNDLDFNTAFQNILSLKRDVEQDVDGTVAEIIANVRSIGDEALFGYAKEFDNFQSFKKDAVEEMLRKIRRLNLSCSIILLHRGDDLSAHQDWQQQCSSHCGKKAAVRFVNGYNR